MLDEKKVENISAEVTELDIDELDKVTGGSITNVQYTPTSDISDNTISNV